MKSLSLLITAFFFISAFFSCTQKTKDSSKEEAPLAASIDTVAEKMVWIPPGTFDMGSNDPAFADAQPIHKVNLKGFWMDEHEVTNAEYERFVKATKYQTVAEQPINPADFPGVPVENLVPGSGVFTPTAQPVSYENPLQWWAYVHGASWRNPK
ncbi:SUMF1/EgtB/PvdO family nonheme iron enzyme, partial [Daejeonella sp.]|uniref:formylglycine-generating enzyme family protein n=1 Tax=Daejeonella sp. TaxID=2805397 RepID=UPI0030C13FE2